MTEQEAIDYLHLLENEVLLGPKITEAVHMGIEALQAQDVSDTNFGDMIKGMKKQAQERIEQAYYKGYKDGLENGDGLLYLYKREFDRCKEYINMYKESCILSKEEARALLQYHKNLERLHDCTAARDGISRSDLSRASKKMLIVVNGKKR